ncbi:MAG: DUF721 domain-containing protein [Flavobacterium sp.]|nr:DUF721 domain-containing protein [Candidatus Neoflavobacterium equi]
MRKKYSEESPVGDVLKLFVQQNKLQAGINQINIKEAWKDMMGSGIANYTQDILLKGSVLHVSLTSSIVREELTYGKQKIIKMLNEDLRADVITDIVFR